MTETTTAAPPRTAVTWFEIPTADLARAQRFYETILGQPLRAENFMGENMAIFPAQEGGVSGCLVEGVHPSPHGTMVYLSVDGRIDHALDLAEQSGGRVDQPKTELPGIGFVARIVDSEGNRVGLHAIF
ncbi:MAG TPA: VOC family protein [Candidatus Elarobacter sp.]